MRMHEWSKMKNKSRRNLNRYLVENPAIKTVYDFKQQLMRLILSRVSGKSAAMRAIPPPIFGRNTDLKIFEV